MDGEVQHDGGIGSSSGVGGVGAVGEQLGVLDGLVEPGHVLKFCVGGPGHHLHGHHEPGVRRRHGAEGIVEGVLEAVPGVQDGPNGAVVAGDDAHPVGKRLGGEDDAVVELVAVQGPDAVADLLQVVQDDVVVPARGSADVGAAAADVGGVEELDGELGAPLDGADEGGAAALDESHEVSHVEIGLRRFDERGRADGVVIFVDVQVEHHVVRLPVLPHGPVHVIAVDGPVDVVIRQRAGQPVQVLLDRRLAVDLRHGRHVVVRRFARLGGKQAVVEELAAGAAVAEA
mmetsp:Transcript_42978/g.100876  ORF Transcript_42978/g.100876 Transcript_42978/m.100876 type:complete len:287 (+) Transcript_42978:661-1521(+)